MIFRKEKFWDVIVANGTIAIGAATITTPTIGTTKAIATSFSFSSMVTQQPSTKVEVFALQHKKNKAMAIFFLYVQDNIILFIFTKMTQPFVKVYFKIFTKARTWPKHCY
jgi:hypothetical protein